MFFNFYFVNVGKVFFLLRVLTSFSLFILYCFLLILFWFVSYFIWFILSLLLLFCFFCFFVCSGEEGFYTEDLATVFSSVAVGSDGGAMAPFPDEVDVFTGPHWRMKQLVGLYSEKVRVWSVLSVILHIKAGLRGLKMCLRRASVSQTANRVYYERLIMLWSQISTETLSLTLNIIFYNNIFYNKY